MPAVEGSRVGGGARGTHCLTVGYDDLGRETVKSSANAVRWGVIKQMNRKTQIDDVSLVALLNF